MLKFTAALIVIFWSVPLGNLSNWGPVELADSYGVPIAISGSLGMNRYAAIPIDVANTTRTTPQTVKQVLRAEKHPQQNLLDLTRIIPKFSSCFSTYRGGDMLTLVSSCVNRYGLCWMSGDEGATAKSISSRVEWL